MRLWLLLAVASTVFGQKGLIPSDAAAVEAGGRIYMGSCSGCHGATGEGSQGPSLLSGRASRLADRALINAIANGLPGTSMPNFPMGEEKVAQVAAFVRSLTAPAIRTQTPGDAERGRQLFYGAGGCVGCHMILGQGGYPGPDLSNIGADRTAPQLRESITRPSARIAEGYRAVKAVLHDGRIVGGVARNHNNYSLQVLDKTGNLHLLQVSAIRTIEWADSSMMPAAQEEDAIHLIAFLARQSTRPSGGVQ